MSNKAEYNRRKEQGICVICGKEKAGDGKVACEKCLENRRNYQRETRKFFRKMKICPRCAKNKLFGEEKTCPECLAQNIIMRKKTCIKKDKTNMDYFNERQETLKELGLCRTGCGRKRAEGKTYCETCLVKHREASRERSRRKSRDGLSRSERPNYGLCYTCGDQLDRDGRICSKCAEKMTLNLPKVHDNKNWRKQNANLFTSR